MYLSGEWGWGFIHTKLDIYEYDEVKMLLEGKIGSNKTSVTACNFWI